MYQKVLVNQQKKPLLHGSINFSTYFMMVIGLKKK
jgi:hypothetical protein